ncbi:MAG: hypothetical protein GX817_05225 [Elusimicrobia bacterium]|nr:hypothetical protein [Elusimicrobiota bacterium]
MKKIFTFALLAGMCTSLAFASQTRIDSLGIADWMIEEDDSLMWMNPARVGESAGNVWAEWPAGGPIGTGYNPTALANPWGGISKSLDLFDFAVFVGKRYTGNLGLTGTTDPNFGPSVGLPTDIGGVFSGTSMDSTTPTGKFDFLVGMTKNERQFGARVSLASDSRVNEADVSQGTPVFFAADFEESFKNSDIELAIGMKTADVWKFESLDLVAQLNMMNAKNLATYSEFDPATNRIELVEENVFDFDGKMGLSAMARGVLPFGTGKLVTKAKFASMDVSSKYSEKVDMDFDYKIDNFGTDIDRIQIREHKGSEILVGAAMNTPITERTLMILGLSLSNTKETLNKKKKSS